MWSDKESEVDYLNFGEVSQIAVDILSSPGMLPVSLGIFGNWGAGKSSLLHLIENELITDEKNWLIIKFDAWLYQGYDDARASFLEVIALELKQAAGENEGLIKKTKSLLSRINGIRLLGLAADAFATSHGIYTGGLISRVVSSTAGFLDGTQTKEEKKDIENATKELESQTPKLFNEKKEATPPQQIDAFRKDYSEIIKELDRPIAVIIDNLDRCLPENAINTLEAIRLFLFLPNTAFIIAADEEMIRVSVAERFKGSTERHQIDYLDKLIQVPIRVPKAGLLEVRSYLFMLFAMQHGVGGKELENLRFKLEESLQQSWKVKPLDKKEALDLTGKSTDENLARAFDLSDRISGILATSPYIHGNPRIVKRLLNVIKMRSNIAARRKIPLDEGIIAKLVIFERCAGAEATNDLYKIIDSEKGKPQIIKELEKGNLKDMPNSAPETWKNNPSVKNFILEWAKLNPKFNDMDLKPAIYLSRETMPLGSYVSGLSPKGKEILSLLANLDNITSPAANKAMTELPLEEHLEVMENLIEHLHQVTDWKSRPKGFAGACLLANHNKETGKILKRFIGGLSQVSPWMKEMLKDFVWYKVN